MTFVDYLRYLCFTPYTKLFYCLLQFDASLSLCYIRGWFFVLGCNSVCHGPHGFNNTRGFQYWHIGFFMLKNFGEN